MDGCDLEWRVTDPPGRVLHVRSRDGRFAVEATIRDDAFHRPNGRVELSVIDRPLILGVEFPPGRPVAGAPFRLGGNGMETARYGVIHTELVRSLLGRWAHRRRYRLPP